MSFLIASWMALHLATQPAQASPHIVKIAAGPAGTEARGEFVLTEERTVFSRTTDREVIVYFQWDGVPGLHKLSAQWRSPDGGTTTSSAFDHTARDRRFGAYWRLTTSPSMQLGTWSIEAMVDGHPAGRFTFEITDANVTPGAPRKVPLTQDQLYERLSRVFFPLRRLAPNGRDLYPAAAYAGGNNALYTALVTLDAVETMQVVRQDGSAMEIRSALGWNRQQGWAVLQGDTAGAEPLTIASLDSIKVGDRCYTMHAAAGGRMIVEGAITGYESSSTGARRLLASFVTGPSTPGAPVVNDFGDVIGIAVSSSPEAWRTGTVQVPGTAIVPLTSFRWNPASAPQAIVDLRAGGHLVAPLAGDEHVLSGGFARGINRGPIVGPDAQSDQFSITEKQFVVFVTWSPQQRLRGMVALRVHDGDNRLIVESKPKKSDLRKGNLTLSTWTLPMLPSPGTYRTDVLLDGRPIWRGYVRIHP